jgi:hypothetical protein
MLISKRIRINIDQHQIPQTIDVMQYDSNTRAIEMIFSENGLPWEIPQNIIASVAFRKADGHGGWYDQLPDGTNACEVTENVVTAILAPQVMTCVGLTKVSVVLQDKTNLNQISSFPVVVSVFRNPSDGEELSSDYYAYKTLSELNIAIEKLEEKIGTPGGGAGTGIHIGPDEPDAGIDVWIDTDESGNGGGAGGGVGAGGYYIPAVTDNGDGTATFGFSPSAADMPTVESVTVTLPKGIDGKDGIDGINGKDGIDGKDGSDGKDGKDGVYTGDSAGIQQYLYDLAKAGISVARFEGTYTISEKTYIPAGMTIQGGTFVSDGEVWMFSAKGDNVRLVNVTLKADRTDRRPDIYEGNSYGGTGTCSNVVGFFSEGHDGVGLIHCVCDGIIPVKFNNGSGVIHGCTVNNAPMFVWGTNVRLIASDNQVSIGDTGLDKYYHVYYLDKDSTLTALHNRIRCDTAVAFADVYHLMTAGNDGTYRAKGIVDGDIVVGNFQKIIDCHYADLILKNCHIQCTNTGNWNEFGNMAHSSFRYENCDLDFTGASAQDFDSSITSGYVVYDGCLVVRTSSLPKCSTFSNCRLDLNGTTAVANLCNVVGCHMVMRMDAAQCVGVIASSNAKFDFIGNRVEFLHPNTNVYLFRYAGLDGFLCNNTFSGVKAGTKLWYNDTALGVTQNNYLKEVASQ